MGAATCDADAGTAGAARRRWRLIGAVAAILALVAAACGADGDPGELGASPTATAPAASTPTAAAPSPTPVDDRLTTASVFVTREGGGEACDDVVARPRRVPAEAPLRGALEALLAGPTATERQQGDTSWFSADTEGMLRGVAIDAAGTAHVDFADFSQVIPGASSSCGSAALLAQLDATVTQFESVTRARYTFDGDAAAFYGWLQRDVPE